jgi:hypothetical protein
MKVFFSTSGGEKKLEEGRLISSKSDIKKNLACWFIIRMVEAARGWRHEVLGVAIGSECMVFDGSNKTVT